MPLRIRIRNFFLRGLTKVMVFLVRMLPEKAGYSLARFFAALSLLLLPSLMRTARKSIELAFGADFSKKDTERIARQSIVHLAYMSVEFMRMGVSTREQVLGMCTEELGGGIEMLKKHLEGGSGVIGLGMHLGNWEYSGAYIALNGISMCAVGKEQKDAFYTNLAFAWRERHGIVNIPRKAKMDPNLLRALKTGGVLGLVGDQNGGSDGVFAPMFGIEASTVAGPAALHLKFKSPLVPIVAWRESPGRLVFEVRPKIYTDDILEDQESPEPMMSREERVREVCARINSAFEELIREHPEQWLWLHRRFKTRPDGEPEIY